MSSFLPINNMNHGQNYSPQSPPPQITNNKPPMTSAKKLTQMHAETLPVQFRRERLQRLVTQTQNCRIDPNYVNNVQGGVLQRTWRRKVAEWLLEFVDEFGLPNDIVAVSVSYMDMYLSKRKTDKQQLQLLAMVCIFVASKFHEVEPISIQELQTLAEGGYTEKSIRDLELDLLSTLNWEMNPITTHHIMRHVANYIPASIRWSLLEHAEGFCDYALTDYDLISMSKINVATAAVLCGLNNIGRKNEDEYWLMNELNTHCNIGSTTLDQMEIETIRTKLTAVFYKNFPHLKPVVDTRGVSPTGVDAFPHVRSSSPTYNQQQQQMASSPSRGPTPAQFAHGNDHYHQQQQHQSMKTKMNVQTTMLVGPTATFVGFQGGNTLKTNSGAFGTAR